MHNWFKQCLLITKSFVNFFKKSTLLFTMLAILVTALTTLVMGYLSTTADINSYFNVRRNQSDLTLINKFSDFDDNDFVFKNGVIRSPKNQSFAQALFPNMFNAYSITDSDLNSYQTFHSFYKYPYQTQANTRLQNATFQLWLAYAPPNSASQGTGTVSTNVTEALSNYNKAHSQNPILLSGNIPIYLIVVKDSAHKMNLWNSQNNDYNNSLIQLKIGNDNDSCIFFKDFYGYGDESPSNLNPWTKRVFDVQGKTIPKKSLISNDNSQPILHMALYKPDYFDNFNNALNPYYKEYGNQKLAYAKYVALNNAIPFIWPNGQPTPLILSDDQALSLTNEYVTAMRTIFYEMSLGAIVQNYHLQQLLNVYDPATLQSLIIQNIGVKGDQIRSPLAKYIVLKQIGYKLGSYTQFQHINDNQILVSNNFDSKQPVFNQNQYRFFFNSTPDSLGPIFNIKGKAHSQLGDNKISPTALVTNTTYHSFLQKLKNSPNANSENEWTGRAFENQNSININFSQNFTYKWGYDIINDSEAGNLIFQNENSFQAYRRTGSDINSLHERVFLLNSALFATCYLILIATIVLMIVITSRVIKQNSRVIGILQANGYKKSPIIISFTFFFVAIFTLSMLIGTALSFACNFGFQKIFEIQNHYIALGVKWHPLIMGIGIGGIPLAGVIITVIILLIKMNNNPLDLLHHHHYHKNKRWFIWNDLFAWFNKRAGFNSKICIKLIAHNKLKLLLGLFIITIGISVIYTTLTMVNIFAAFSYYRSANAFTYFNALPYNYGFDSSYSGEFNHYNEPQRHSVNNTNLISVANFQKYSQGEASNIKYHQIKINFQPSSGSPSLDPETIQYLNSSRSLQNTWVKANDIQKTYKYCSVHSQECSNTFDKKIPQIPNIYEQAMAIYENNYISFKNLDQHNGVISIGFQIFNETTDNRGIRGYPSVHKVSDASETNIQQFLERSNLSRKNWPQGIDRTQESIDYLSNYSFLAGTDNLLKMQTSVSNTEVNNVMRINNNDEAVPFLSADQQKNWNLLSEAVHNYNQETHSGNQSPYKYDIVLCPVFVDIHPNGRQPVEVGNTYVNKVTDLNRISDTSGSHKYGLLYVMDPIGVTRNLLNYTYAPYTAANSMYLSRYLGVSPYNNDYHGDVKGSTPDVIPDKVFNFTTSNYDLDYWKKYVGVFEPFGVYGPTVNKPAGYQIQTNVYWQGISNFQDSLASSLKSISVIIWAVITIAIISVAALMAQITVTNNIILKDNANIINNLSTMGYSRWWVFRKLGIIFAPILILSVAFALPVGIILSRQLFSNLSIILGVNIIPVFSYFNIVYSLIIILAVFIIGFLWIWKHFRKHHPLYKFVLEA